MSDIHDYSDIINMPRHKSLNHPPMERINRAAQFAPFAALTGYEESIFEAGRIVNEKKILTNEQKEKISNTLNYLNLHKKDNIEIILFYFVKDETKNGGTYQVKKGVIKKIDEFNKTIKFNDNTTIKFENIYKIIFDTLNEQD